MRTFPGREGRRARIRRDAGDVKIRQRAIGAARLNFARYCNTVETLDALGPATWGQAGAWPDLPVFQGRVKQGPEK